jgi:RNA 2',3'-cyclic 3'-phosphodiesterase
MSGDEVRLFVACDIPPAVLQTIRAWQHDQLEGHTDVRVNHALHITLAFLGLVPRGEIPRLREALSELAYPPIDMRVAEGIFLPERGAKRVIALRLCDPSGALVQRQRCVVGALAATGLYEPEKRAWLPHLTVARFRRSGHPFSLQNVNISEFGVVRTVLYSSLLERAGAVHTPLADFPAS